LADHQKRLVRECAILLNNRRYIPVDQAGWETLHAMNEREVVIAYNQGDIENAAAVDLNGNFLAALQPEELVRFAPFDPYTKAQVAESMSQRRHLEKQTRNTLSAITLVARKNGAQTPLEAMAQRLQLPADTDLDDVEWMLSVPAQHPLAGGAPLR
jgi:hypothetical protein